MKKAFGRISVIVLALLMVFSFGACGDNIVKVDTTGEALAGAAAAMLNQSGITVDVDANVEIPATGKVSADVTAKIAKANKDYDFAVNGMLTRPVGPMTAAMSLNVVKKGNILYTDSSTTNVSSWETSYVEAIDTTGLGALIKDAVGDLSEGELKKGKKGYTVTFAEDYGATLNTVIATINLIAPQNLGEFVEAMLGMQKGGLVDAVKKIFADGITVSEMISEIDTVLAGLGEASLNTGMIVDSLMLSAGITAEVLQGMLESAVSPAGKTPYQYLMVLFGDMPVDTLLSVAGSIGGNDNGPEQGVAENDENAEQPDIITVATIREMLMTALGENGMTVGELWDKCVGFLDKYIGSALSYVADKETYKTLVSSGKPILCVDNLAKMTVGENRFSVALELNGDLTVKNFNIIVKNDIKYDGNALVKIDINAVLGFSYGKVGIDTPNADFIAPCVLADEYLDIAALPLSGGYAIQVYAGKGYTVAQPECKYYDYETYDYVDISGVSYADGKISFTAAAVEEIRNQVLDGNEVIVTLTATGSGTVEPMEWEAMFVNESAYGF